MRPAVFLDRDGVLNQAVIREGRPYPPDTVDTLIIIQEAAQALSVLRRCGFVLICVTNQPDIARGTRRIGDVEAINRRVMEELPLNDLFMCPHDNRDHCRCRKPKPGMLLDAARKWGVDLSRSWMVGDRAGDVDAGRAAGCRTVFIDCGYAEAKPDPEAEYTCRSVLDAAIFIQKQRNLDAIPV